MALRLDPLNRDEKLVLARALRLGKTINDLYEPWTKELVRLELTEDDPIMDIRPQVAKYEERAAAAAAARQAQQPSP